MTHIVTAKKMELHVGSGDDGALNAAVFGSGLYVLSGCAATVVSANKVTIAGGEILMHGRHIRVGASGESVAIDNGAQARKRHDLIGILYRRDAANQDIEDAPLHVLKGAAVPDSPADPAYNASASILKGDAEVFRPLYRVPIDGLSVGAPVPLYGTLGSLSEAFADLAGKADKAHKHPVSDMTGGALPISLGGTGATSAAGARNALGLGNTAGALPVANGGTGVTTDAAIALKSYPVGALYVSFSATSPASLFGGTWAQISGRFLRAASGTGTGGSDTCTLTSGQMPNHHHGVISERDGDWMGLWQSNVSEGGLWWIVSNGTPGANRGLKTTSVGGGGSHNNMPAYQDVYVWRRTA
ncbi:hypothetical protein ABG947_00465 [Eggerthella lenta]|uniref:phage baseplate protein n=1 Tax=Eggerthella lenta TaxID=84112 RepID=UPI00325B69E0